MTPLYTLCDFPLSSDNMLIASSSDLGFSKIRPFSSTTVSQATVKNEAKVNQSPKQD